MQPAEKQLQALQAAVKTIRKTGLYGKNDEVTIQWPKEKDLLEMVKNIPRKIKHFKYKNSANFFRAFQVVLSNDVASPVFTASGKIDQDMQ